MGALDVLTRLSELGVRLTRSGEAILAAPRSALTDEARALIRAHKPALLAVLSETRLYPAESSGHWLVIEPARRLEKYFTPHMTRAQLMERYPGALLVALPDSTAPPPAREEQANG